MSLSKESTLEELFSFIYSEDHDVSVMPVTLSKPGDEVAKLMIVIQGSPNTSHHIMANLMSSVQDMYDLAKQKDEDKPPTIEGNDDGATGKKNGIESVS